MLLAADIPFPAIPGPSIANTSHLGMRQEFGGLCTISPSVAIACHLTRPTSPWLPSRASSLGGFASYLASLISFRKVQSSPCPARSSGAGSSCTCRDLVARDGAFPEVLLRFRGRSGSGAASGEATRATDPSAWEGDSGSMAWELRFLRGILSTHASYRAAEKNSTGEFRTSQS